MSASQVDLGKLEVDVVECKDLMQADRWSQSDPYVVVTFGDEWRKTYAIQNTNNPVFKDQEPFYFEVRSKDSKLIIDVFDENRLTKDVFLGQVEISLRQLEDGSFKDSWWPLKPRIGTEQSKADAIQGEIRLKIDYTWSRLSEMAAAFLNEDQDMYRPKEKPKAEEFSLNVLISNITVLYAHLLPIINWYYRQWDYWLWMDSASSITMFATYSFIALHPWFIPTLLPAYIFSYMLYNYIEVGGKYTPADDDDYLFGVEENEQKVDMGFLGISYYKSQMAMMQQSIGETNVWFQGNKDLFNWKYPETTKFIMYGLVAITILWSIFPFRFTMFVITIYLFTRYTRFYNICWMIYKGLYKLVSKRFGQEAEIQTRVFGATDSKKSKSKAKAKAKAKAKKSKKANKVKKAKSRKSKKAFDSTPVAVTSPAPAAPAHVSSPASTAAPGSPAPLAVPASPSADGARSPSSKNRSRSKHKKRKRKAKTPTPQ